MYNKDIYPALQTFGIEHLRDEQERALTPILAGRDVLVRLRKVITVPAACTAR